MSAKVDTYIARIIEKINTIPFYAEGDEVDINSSTLGAEGLVFDYEKSLQSKPITEIHVFSTSLTSAFLETKINNRGHGVIIRLISRLVDRERQAQLDLNYLREQILTILENSLSDTTWGDGYLDNETFNISPRTVTGNYFVISIPLTVYQRVTVTN